MADEKGFGITTNEIPLLRRDGRLRFGRRRSDHDLGCDRGSQRTICREDREDREQETDEVPGVHRVTPATARR